MIASVRGPVRHVGLDHLVVEVGGVGLLVHTTPATASEGRTGAEITLETTLVVREESLTLYGFAGRDAKALFEQVQTVSGVGPRLALAMLSVHAPEAVRAAIATGDLAALTKVPGIGKKSAERLVLELKDKIVAAGVDPAALPVAPAGGDDAVATQVRAALEGLGWSAKQAADAVRTVTSAEGAPREVAAVLRAALRELGR
ncbi:Holliday junction branch migration protein RuvA [Ornithinimicrobium tianjinense]|uniref:Holliday junction branch migration complex subunit RuvA n=1 Tax=Ornithinimicrobium tianjinense TaxID=1195761 RepID=A0A917F5X6_9MICO|nr:Holliday junction branch migration protein RuvA [Ornithinimicrobium tianjinense]GGF46789.1 Holliday junction ATP-dependent DNA helicase RuvA [Ornithinimicrobium tianjinense]